MTFHCSPTAESTLPVKFCAFCRRPMEMSKHQPFKKFCGPICKQKSYKGRKTMKPAPALPLAARMDALRQRIGAVERAEPCHPHLPEMRRHFVLMFNLLDAEGAL